MPEIELDVSRDRPMVMSRSSQLGESAPLRASLTEKGEDLCASRPAAAQCPNNSGTRAASMKTRAIEPCWSARAVQSGCNT